jgi:hypothetical protein
LVFKEQFSGFTNQVETYERIIDPVDFKYYYRLRDYGTELQECAFAMDKFYLAADGHPAFNISFYRGSARRIAYTFNNTDPTGYSPPPCAVDWPEMAYAGKYSWLITHCPNVVSVLLLLKVC